MPGNRIDHALMVSLNVLLLTVVGVALLAYQVSPLRDPSFIPQAANAGARVSWLNPEKYWMAAIRIFSIALATNISLLTWSQLRGNRDGIVRFSRNRASTALKVLGLCGVWLIVFYSFWYFSLLFLLWQYIID
ncbi:MAG: hypothetical protein AAGI69_16000 [Cyanobacteria bacterium P01_H01_bin.21]